MASAQNIALFVILSFIGVGVVQAANIPNIFHYVGPSYARWDTRSYWYDIVHGEIRFPTLYTDYMYIDSCATVWLPWDFSIWDATLANAWPDVGCGGNLKFTAASVLTVKSFSVVESYCMIFGNDTTYQNSPYVWATDGTLYDGIWACGGQCAFALETRTAGRNITLTETSTLLLMASTCYLLVGGNHLVHYGKVLAPYGGFVCYRSLSAQPIYSYATINSNSTFIFQRDPSDHTPVFDVHFFGNWTAGGWGNTTFWWYNWTMYPGSWFLHDGTNGSVAGLPSGFFDILSPINMFDSALRLKNGGVYQLRSSLRLWDQTFLGGNGTFVVNWNGNITWVGTGDYNFTATRITNYGLLTLTNGSRVQFSGPFDEPLKNGTLVRITTAFNDSSAAKLVLNGASNATIRSPVSLSGTVFVNGGSTLTINNGSSVANLQLSGGTVKGPGSLSVATLSLSGDNYIFLPTNYTGAANITNAGNLFINNLFTLIQPGAFLVNSGNISIATSFAGSLPARIINTLTGAWLLV